MECGWGRLVCKKRNLLKCMEFYIVNMEVFVQKNVINM